MADSFTYHTQPFEGNMNEKMLSMLTQPDAKGVVLFFIYGGKGKEAPGFILPPFFAEGKFNEFQEEFFKLLMKYKGDLPAKSP